MACFCFFKHYMPVSQANWCNMTFKAGNLFPSHSCIDVARVKPPHWDSNLSMRNGQLTNN